MIAPDARVARKHFVLRLQNVESSFPEAPIGWRQNNGSRMQRASLSTNGRSFDRRVVHEYWRTGHVKWAAVRVDCTCETHSDSLMSAGRKVVTVSLYLRAVDMG